jgi:hypothetical protein
VRRALAASKACPKQGVCPAWEDLEALKVLPHDASPLITRRDATIPLAAAHTLTRVGGPKPPRHGPSLHTAKTGNEAHHCGQLPPSHLQHTPCPPP